ncbi:MAG: winged helix-turn-helix domain-containing protein [Candidatus Bipolaricaulia bacterium]
MKHHKVGFTWIWTAFLILCIATLGMLSIYLISTSLEQEFVNTAGWLSHGFADEVSLHILAGNENKLDASVKRMVRNYVLYAQVVKGGEVLAEDRTGDAINLDLPVASLPSAFKMEKRRLPSGTPYIDMIRSLPLQNPEDGGKAENYVRIGISLSKVRAEVRDAASIVLSVGFALVIVGILLSFYLARRIYGPAQELAGSGNAAFSPTMSIVNSDGSILKVGDLVIDDGNKEVQIRRKRVALSPKEYQLAKLLASEPGKVFSDQEILDAVWTGNHLAVSNDVKKYIYLLRQKIEEDPEDPQIILTVRGFGYKLST